MKTISRDLYLEKLIRVIGTPDIKVITGVRRSGKSFLMAEFIQYIKNSVKNANIISVDLALKKNDKFLDGSKLYAKISLEYDKTKRNFVFIDEVQLCKDFERVISSLHAEKMYDIYITGSNAFLLSSDLATLFTGRTFSIHVLPFSFKEYLEIKDIKFSSKSPIEKQSAFESYVIDGGMPGSYAYPGDSEKTVYLNEVYDALIMRDIVERKKVQNPQLLDNINDYLMDNISNISSSNNIANTLVSLKQQKTNNHTVSSYISYLCEAYAFYKISRFDIRGKKILESLNKYYMVDLGFRRARLGARRESDFGRIYENLVALELIRRGYKVYVGVLYNSEVDFIVEKNDGSLLYIQVAANISDENVLRREISPLLSIRDAHSKIILARTAEPEHTQDGVIIKDLAEWLAE